MNNPEANAQFLASLSMGRWGTIEQSDALACYLCSDAAGFITGTDPHRWWMDRKVASANFAANSVQSASNPNRAPRDYGRIVGVSVLGGCRGA
jgi:hypothetical protein